MAFPDVSSDEGEIAEATPLPHSKLNGDIDRTGRPRARLERTPEPSKLPDHRQSPRVGHARQGSFSRHSRSPRSPPPPRSPRGFKRSRDDDRHDRDRDRDRRDPRHFRVHYDDDRGGSRYRDLDRPPSRGSINYNDDWSYSARNRYGSSRDVPPPTRPSADRVDDRGRDRELLDYDRERNHDSHSTKRPRNHRSRSPRGGRRDNNNRGRRDNRGRVVTFQPEGTYQDGKDDRRGQEMSKGNTHTAAACSTKEDAKSGQGVPVERGVKELAIAQDGPSQQEASKEPEPDMDWDPSEAMDEEARVQAEIERRRRARQAALQRGLGAASPSVQSLQGDKPSPTPSSSRFNTPAPQKTEPSSPKSRNVTMSPTQSPAQVPNTMSPSAFNFFLAEQDLARANGNDKVEVDGPSAADYDPTADMKEDERRDELRHGHVGLHGEAKHPALADVAKEEQNDEEKQPEKGGDDDDDEFDMFADDFDEEKLVAPAASKKAGNDGQANVGGGKLEGDDKDGYYKIRPGELLDGRYQLSTALGRGMFSGVARALDLTTQQTVAIKIMRNNDALRKGGFTEIAILQKLNEADPEDKKHIVKFERSFEYKGHLCMVFENLSMNLREVLKKFGNNIGINLRATRVYAYQIFLALAHMRKCSIIHADLKPDNILVNEARNLLKICDLGTAIDRSDAATASTEVTPYLVSRFYRAPEVILGIPYDYSVDMWSIGCTLYELYTGKILFTGDSNNQMLKTIMEIRGRLNAKLYRRGELWGMHWDDMGNFLSVERDKVLGKTTVKTLATVKPTRDLRARLVAASSGMSDAETKELNHFIDLLERCLALNPDKRITPFEALKHPFFGQAVAATAAGPSASNHFSHGHAHAHAQRTAGHARA
ncbi:kinase-like domain-containing protein [Neurospora crassa]|nr:kinase-like domain-containing protein [Neurospora crassa]